MARLATWAGLVAAILVAGCGSKQFDATERPCDSEDDCSDGQVCVEGRCQAPADAGSRPPDIQFAEHDTTPEEDALADAAPPPDEGRPPDIPVCTDACRAPGVKGCIDERTPGLCARGDDGCLFLEPLGPCVGDACMHVTCDPDTGGCLFEPVDCDDESECTADSCDDESGCRNELICDPLACQTCVGRACVSPCNPDYEVCDGAGNCVPSPSCGAPRPIVCGETLPGDTTFAPGAPGHVPRYPACSWLDESGPENAYLFVPTEDAEVHVRLEGLSDDLDLFAVGDGCGGDGCVAASTTRGDGDEELVFAATAGEAVHLLVDAVESRASPYRLVVASCEPLCVPSQSCDTLGRACGPHPDCPLQGCGSCGPGERCDEAGACAYDPCVAMPPAGCCDGEVARSCRIPAGSAVGTPHEDDCAARTMACGYAAESGAFVCGGVDPVPAGVDLACPEDCGPFTPCEGLGRVCGPHPDCSWHSCGDCDAGAACDEAGQCAPCEDEVPCAGIVCGAGRCGVDCGTCDAGHACVSGVCFERLDGSCTTPLPIACSDAEGGHTARGANTLETYATAAPDWRYNQREVVFALGPREHATYVTASLSNLRTDLDLIVLRGTCAEDAAGEVADAPGTRNETLGFFAAADTTVYLVVDGTGPGDAGGPFRLSAFCQPAICTPGEIHCGPEGDVETCADDGLSWDGPSTACAAGCEETAEGAVCRTLCAPGETRCRDDGHLLTCDANAVVWRSTPCAGGCEADGDVRRCVATPFTESEPNDDANDATWVTVPWHTRGTLTSGDEDYVRFDVAEASVLRVETFPSGAGRAVDVRLWLYEVGFTAEDPPDCHLASGCHGYDDDLGWGYYGLIDGVEVPRGTYVVRVAAFGDGAGDYELTIDACASDCGTYACGPNPACSVGCAGCEWGQVCDAGSCGTLCEAVAPRDLTCDAPLTGGETRDDALRPSLLDTFVCGGFYEQRGAEDVYRIVASQAGWYGVTISSLTDDRRLFWMTNACDVSHCLNVARETVRVNLLQGQTTYLVVESDSGDVSPYSLDLNCP